MAEIKLQKRYKYAGDIMPKLLDIGFDLETANDFLNSIPDADVAPRADVAREIFAEIEDLMREWFDFFRQGDDIRESCAIMAALSQISELKKKYTEGQK